MLRARLLLPSLPTGTKLASPQLPCIARGSRLLVPKPNQAAFPGRCIHFTSRTHGQQQQRQEQQSSGPQGDPQSFFNAFVASVKKQVAENKEMQQNLKQLGDGANAFVESDAVKRAVQLGEKSTSKVGEVVNKVGDKLSEVAENEAVKKTVDTVVKGIDTVEEVAEKAAKPILDTKIAQTVQHDLFDTSTNYHYREYKPKHIRDKELEERQRREAVINPNAVRERLAISANPDAGTGVVMHKSSRMAEAWEKIKQNNPVMKSLFSLNQKIEESDSPIMDTIRDWKDRLTDIFGETETGKVYKAFNMAQPGFRLDKHLLWMTEYAVPEFLESLLKGDLDVLKEWTSEATYSVLAANIKSQKQQGLVSACKLIDIRELELHSAKLLNDEIPVLVVTFRTQEILCFKNLKGEVAVGKEDLISTSSYATVWTKDQVIDPTAPIDAKRNGWRVMELAKHNLA